MMRTVTGFVILSLQEWGQGVWDVYSALSITIGLLFDMYVPSSLISTFVCSLRSKGQDIGKIKLFTLLLSWRLHIKSLLLLF